MQYQQRQIWKICIYITSVSESASLIQNGVHLYLIMPFREIPDSQYYCAEEAMFWSGITGLILTGFRVR